MRPPANSRFGFLLGLFFLVVVLHLVGLRYFHMWFPLNTQRPETPYGLQVHTAKKGKTFRVKLVKRSTPSMAAPARSAPRPPVVFAKRAVSPPKPKSDATVAKPAPPAASEVPERLPPKLSPSPQELATAASPSQTGTAEIDQDAQSGDFSRMPPDYIQKVLWIIEQHKQYPYEARVNGIEGSVTVGFIIQRDGNLSTLELLKPSPFQILNTTAMSVVRKSAPFPPLPPEITVREYPIKLTIHFELQQL